jgi:predicted RNA polymerase sigma factor
MLVRLGRRDEAETAYRQALSLTRNAAERSFLRGRIDGLSDRIDPA